MKKKLLIVVSILLQTKTLLMYKKKNSKIHSRDSKKIDTSLKKSTVRIQANCFYV